MKKAVLSNRIMLTASPEYVEYLDKELTYVIPGYNESDPPEIIKNLARVRDNIVSIPIGRIDLIPEDYEVVDRRLTPEIELPEFRFTLRDSQQLIYDQVDDNCIINAWPSWGKTFTGLAIAKKLGLKTLVIVHNIQLRNQWKQEVEKVFGFKPGIIGSGRLEVAEPLCIGNTQTLYRNISLVQKEFGTVILDEMHHVPSRTFSSVLDTNHARYKIGLSGTLERKDGKHVVFRDYFGDNVYKAPRENSMTPRVDLIHTGIRFLDGSNYPWADKVTQLTTKEEYIHLVAMTAAAYAARGHNVLVVADRVAFLKKVAELIGEKAVCITGDIKELDERERLLRSIGKDKSVLCGTMSIFKEGISHNPLSCLILGTPVNNDPLLTQLIGRIIRKLDGKLQPTVVDILLKGNTARRQANNRIGHYMREGYHIRELQ